APAPPPDPGPPRGQRPTRPGATAPVSARSAWHLPAGSLVSGARSSRNPVRDRSMYDTRRPARTCHMGPGRRMAWANVRGRPFASYMDRESGRMRRHPSHPGATPMRYPPSATRTAAVLAIALGLAAPQAAAQSFLDRLGRTIERAAESEVHRQADRRTREATRCALGDERCIVEARRQGRDVQVTGSGTASSVDPGGDHPLIVPYAGSQRCAREYSDYHEATRVIGKENGLHVTETQEGRYNRLYYHHQDGRP